VAHGVVATSDPGDIEALTAPDESIHIVAV
jgi:hypothetical protein